LPQTSTHHAITWFLQRIFGIFLAFFLLTHINFHHLLHDIGTQGIIDFEYVTENLHGSFWWKIYYILFVPIVLFHGLNGIWQIIVDFRPNPSYAAFIKLMLWAAGMVLVMIALLTLLKLF